MKNILTIMLAIIAIPSICLGANKTTTEVKITQISSSYDQALILIQTDPRPDISGLGCTNDYWLMLYNKDIAYKSMLSMLLSAYATGRNVNVVSDDSNGGEFCRLGRVVLN